MQENEIHAKICPIVLTDGLPPICTAQLQALLFQLPLPLFSFRITHSQPSSQPLPCVSFPDVLFPSPLTCTPAAVSRPNPLTHHNVLLHSIFLSSHSNPSFLLPSGREMAPRKDSHRWSIRSERVVYKAVGDWFCFPELFTGCLTTYISLYFLTVDNHGYFFIIFCQSTLTSGLFLLLTLTLSGPLGSLASFLMAHRDTSWVLPSDTGEPFPAVGLQPPPTLEEPLFLMLLMLHIKRFRITQCSCSSPCSKLHCMLSLHSLFPSEKHE